MTCKEILLYFMLPFIVLHSMSHLCSLIKERFKSNIYKMCEHIHILQNIICHIRKEPSVKYFKLLMICPSLLQSLESFPLSRLNCLPFPPWCLVTPLFQN